MELQPQFGEPGCFKVPLMPGQPGDCRMWLFGTVSGTSFDHTYDLGSDPEMLVKAVSDATFPQPTGTKPEAAAVPATPAQPAAWASAPAPVATPASGRAGRRWWWLWRPWSPASYPGGGEARLEGGWRELILPTAFLTLQRRAWAHALLVGTDWSPGAVLLPVVRRAITDPRWHLHAPLEPRLERRGPPDPGAVLFFILDSRGGERRLLLMDQGQAVEVQARGLAAAIQALLGGSQAAYAPQHWRCSKAARAMA